MAATALLDSSMARIIQTVSAIAVLGVGGVAVTTTMQNSAAQEVRDMAKEMKMRWGKGGSYTTSSSEDVTALAITQGIVPDSRINRATTPPTARNADDGTIVLALEPTRRVITYTGLKQSTCAAMVEETDISRDLASVTVGSTVEAAAAGNELTQTRLRSLAALCAANATVVWRWI